MFVSCYVGTGTQNRVSWKGGQFRTIAPALVPFFQLQVKVAQRVLDRKDSAKSETTKLSYVSQKGKAFWEH